MKYILIDTANLYFKSKYIASRGVTDWERIGMALHLTLSGVQHVIRKFSHGEPIHVVFALEGRSWRKDFYKPYKATRAVNQAELTQEDIELSKMFSETFDNFIDFLSNKTNVSVLRCPTAEADDIIARFIHLHPTDDHFILSSDSDYHQLISPKVQQYNSIAGQLVTIDGFFDNEGNKIKDKKTGEHKTLGDPQYVLFEKCMRGDTSDNVFSAYPGVRTKSTKKTTGLLEAYADRISKGFNWNNVMLQRWSDHEGVEHRVLDDYERNVKLIDLTAQPQDVKDKVDEAIILGIRRETVPQVGIHFMKFCGKYDLDAIGKNADSYAKWLNAPYEGDLK